MYIHMSKFHIQQSKVVLFFNIRRYNSSVQRMFHVFLEFSPSTESSVEDKKRVNNV